MVVFVDFEDDTDESHASPGEQAAGFALPERPRFANSTMTRRDIGKSFSASADERANPNVNTLSRALGCYPIITLLASHIDLNTLHALSRTCRQIRANLLQYRNQLVQQTLRCTNETHDTSHRPQPPPPGLQRWHILGEAGHIVSGKVSSCARDLVSDCRRCGQIVCRNCTSKPPPLKLLSSRLRRLCSTCLAVPLTELTTPSSGVSRDPCICEDAVHLCAPCGAKLAEADTTYRRVWTWRTRYTTYLGGLGTGIGEGNEGVKCARGADCKGALEVEVEFECPTSGSNSTPSLTGSGSGTGSDTDEPLGTPMKEKEEAGYWRQEIEGLGGVVKKKFRKRERIGGTVREWEDESKGGAILAREKSREERAWCGWCARVVRANEE